MEKQTLPGGDKLKYPTLKLYGVKTGRWVNRIPNKPKDTGDIRWEKDTMQDIIKINKWSKITAIILICLGIILLGLLLWYYAAIEMPYQQALHHIDPL